MISAAVAAIDWAQPWFAPLRDSGRQVTARVASGMAVAEALNAMAPPGVRFVAQRALPAGEAYEAFVARTATVPTRDNLHDLFNGLVWLRHAALKFRLNALHAQAIGQSGVGPTRGPLRDALTLFDEYGALWTDAPAPLRAALAAREWQRLFVDLRTVWALAGIEVFGHALLEQLACAPRKALTAHLVAADPLRWRADTWAAKPFMPMPVLGVPGWWPANEDPGFYADAAVFRPRRPAGPNTPAMPGMSPPGQLNSAPGP